MLFNSLAFAIFLPIVFLLYQAVPNKYKQVLLLAASYYFYMSWNVKYVVLILFTTAISYACGILLVRYPKFKKQLLILTMIACFSVLFFFKYFNFFQNTLCRILNRIAIPLSPITLKLMLPVGISFYTFQTMSYVIDVYRGQVEPEHSFITYAAFISFFPQLVAGPIERTSNLLPQIKNPKPFHKESAEYGLKLMAWGLFKKLVIADNLATYADQIFGATDYYSGFSMMLAAAFFTIQIYCDFSGYSDIAIGCARLFGISLMTNFKSPYFSASIKEFWGRWHISLSTWFRDYVYIPLGGNRTAKWRHNMNLLITFLVSGLWHGAAFTFIIWGGIHGILQILENILPPLRAHAKRVKEQTVSTLELWSSRVVTFFLAMMAWVFFRAESAQQAFLIWKNMWLGITSPGTYFIRGFQDMDMTMNGGFEILAMLLLLSVYDYVALKKDPIECISRLPKKIRWAIYYGFVFLIIMLASFNSQEFIYFDF